MGDIVVQLSILDPLYTLFGWLTRVLFGFFGNYGLAIIFLTIIIRAALIPLNVKSHKSMLKMQAMSGKQAELQRMYGDDKEKYREEVMKLQKENGAGGLSGCLLPILQIFIIWPMFRIVSGPLIYLSGVSKTNIQSMIGLGNSLGEGGIFAAQMTAENHIGLIKALNENSQFLNECINRGFIKLDQMIDLHFLGMDLTVTPAWKPSVIVKVDALTEEFSSPKGRKKLLDSYVQSSEAGEPWLIPAEQFDIQQVKPLTLADLAISDTVKLSKQAVAAIIGVPSFLLGVGKYKKDAWNNFVNTTIKTICTGIQQEETKKLIMSPKWYIKFNYTSLLDWDLQTISTVFGGLSDRGFITGNEVRDKIGMSPLDGLDELRVLENYIPVEKSGSQKKLIQEGE